MKKIISLVIACALCLGMVFAFTSCDMLGIYLLSGTYENDGLFGLGDSSYTFGLDGSVTYTIEGKSFTGTYEIEKTDAGTLEIEFDYEDEGILSLDGEYKFVQGEENGVKYIEIGGVRYDKAK